MSATHTLCDVQLGNAEFACLCVAVCDMGTWSLEQDVNGMGQLHFAAIGDDTGRIEWLVPARHFVFMIHTGSAEPCFACAHARLRQCLRATACLMPTH